MNGDDIKGKRGKERVRTTTAFPSQVLGSGGVCAKRLPRKLDGARIDPRRRRRAGHGSETVKGVRT